MIEPRSGANPPASTAALPRAGSAELPGNPTRSFRAREPVRIVGELTGWTGYTDEQLQTRRDPLTDLAGRGAAVIYD